MPSGMELSLSLSLQCSMVGIADDRYVGNILKPLYFFFDSAVPKDKRDSYRSHWNLKTQDCQSLSQQSIMMPSVLDISCSMTAGGCGPNPT